jgi:type I restriction enzyme R subunit
MSYEYSEDGLVEAATQQVLEELGWRVLAAWRNETFGNNGLLGRETKSEVILKRHLGAALMKLNPGLPEMAYSAAIDKLEERVADQSLARTNKEKSTLLMDGIPVSYTNAKGELMHTKLRVFDFETFSSNDFLAVRQLEVVGPLYNRRTDIVGFVNGIPLLFFELKAHHKDLRHAFDDNLRDYKDSAEPAPRRS